MTVSETPASPRIAVDIDRCVGGGQCVLAAPEVFDQDDEGLVVVLDRTPAPDLLHAVDEAVRRCPGQVLSLVRQNTDQ